MGAIGGVVVDETFVGDDDFVLVTGFFVVVIVIIESSSRGDSNVRFNNA